MFKKITNLSVLKRLVFLSNESSKGFSRRFGLDTFRSTGVLELRLIISAICHTRRKAEALDSYQSAFQFLLSIFNFCCIAFYWIFNHAFECINLKSFINKQIVARIRKPAKFSVHRKISSGFAELMLRFMVMFAFTAELMTFPDHHSKLHTTKIYYLEKYPNILSKYIIKALSSLSFFCNILSKSQQS